ncbi:MAG TPA: hypothetical protein PK514_13480 [Spirochaetota bacterium]|nr:hypothetical protein [Spirochaetota bacterium]
MKNHKKHGQCAYCGAIGPLTDDHIPPKNIFPKPRASNLITVPCCITCFEGWSKDDEYFRAAIISSYKVSDEPSACSVINTLIRSANRSEGFALLLKNSIKDVDVFTEAGIYLGQEGAFKLDVNRIDRVAQRIIRGLFFNAKGYPFPTNYQVIAKIQQFGLNDILEKLQGINFPPLIIIQNGIFCYTYHETIEDVNSGVWILLFYGTLPIVGITKPYS